jgi:type I restriction enzyme S subunit
MVFEEKSKFKQTEVGIIPGEWTVEQLKDLCVDISYGYTASATEEPIGPRFLRITDIVPYFIDWRTVPFCKISDLDRAKYRLDKGDIVIARTGANTGANATIRLQKDVVFASYLIRFKINPKEVDPFFVGYVLKSNLWQNFVSGILGGSAQPGVNAKQLGSFSLPVPALAEQKSIAKIFFDIDSRIELNLRINKTLEAISQAIFKRWFVDFEFPNEEGKPYKSHDGKMMDSELGEIPAGWTVGCLGDIADNVRNPVKPEDAEPDTPYIGLEHMPRKSIGLADWGHVEDVGSNKSSFHRKDVLFGKLRPYFHKVGVAPIDGICSTDILVVTAKQPEFLGMVLFYFASDELVKYADMTSSGTKMPRTSWSDLAQYRILIPSKEIMRDFTGIIYPMVEKIIGNVLQSKTLVSMRDSLLPKLMSGKIRVPVTEEKVEAS